MAGVSVITLGISYMFRCCLFVEHDLYCFVKVTSQVDVKEEISICFSYLFVLATIYCVLLLATCTLFCNLAIAAVDTILNQRLLHMGMTSIR